MEDVYQKRTRSNTIVPPEKRSFGRTVWVGNGTRYLRICGRHGELLTLEEYTKKNEKLKRLKGVEHSLSSEG